VRSRDQALRDRDDLVAQLPVTVQLKDFQLKLSAFVAGYGDGHTTMGQPPLDGTRAVFPPDVQWVAGQLVLTDRIPPGLSRGDRILQINSHDPAALLREWDPLVSGERPEYRRAMSVASFRTLLQVRGFEPPYSLRIAGVDGLERDVNVEGARPADFPAERPSPPDDLRSEVFGFRVLDGGVGYMNLRSLAGSQDGFNKDVSKMITLLNEVNARSLVVDVRDNPGGDARLIVALLDHLAKRPYTLDYGEVKISGPIHWRLPAVPRWLGMGILVDGLSALKYRSGMIIRGDPPKYRARAAQPFFNGNFCVLTGPGSFSAAVVFADVVRLHHLGTVIGEETGGTANMHGVPVLVQLPKSKIVMQVGTGRFLRGNGDHKYTGGVVPDIFVATTIEDIRAGRDPVLERAMSCPDAP
jgi:hypothetical protein